MMQIGNLGARTSDLRTHYFAGRCIDDDALAFEANIGVDVADHRALLGVVANAALTLDGDKTLAVAALRKREVGEIAVHHDANVARRPLEKRAAQPFARVRVDVSRHVAIEMLDVGAREPRLDVDRAGPVRGRLPRARRGSRRVTVGESEIVDADLQR